MSLNVYKARTRMIKKERQSLDFLLKYRSKFFLENIPEGRAIIVDIGAGIDYLDIYLNKKIFSTDIQRHNWHDFVSDAHNLPIKENSIDIAILNNVLHHFSSPMKVLQNVRDILKDNGTILIYDVTLSLVHKFLIKSGISNEKYDASFDIYNPNVISKNSWEGNNATPDLLFEKSSEMEKLGLKIVSRQYCEFLIFLTSGGVTNRFPLPDFSYSLSRFFFFFDKILLKMFSNTFALQQRVILKKI